MPVHHNERMDPRQQRTWSRLSAAVLQLAAERSIADVTVTDIAKAADISRDTFYRYAPGAPELLARVLGEELDALLHAFVEGDDTDPRHLFDVSESALIGHVAAHRAVYLAAMSPNLASPLRTMLSSSIQSALLEYLAQHPELAPPAPSGLPLDEAHHIYAAYGASGTVGAIESWLAGGAEGDADAVAQAIIAASATWWWSGR